MLGQLSKAYLLQIVVASKPMDPTSLSGGPEWRLLLAVCRPHPKQDEIRLLLQVPLLWNELLALAETHGVLPLLHEALEPVRSSVGPEISNQLASKHQTNIHKAMMLSRELVRIQDALAEAGVEAMPYKGLALAETVYGDIGLRQTGDIDLLIRPKDVGRAREALRGLDYSPHVSFSERQERAYLRSGYEYVFDAPAGRNLLEVQWAIQPRFYAVNLSTDELFERSITVSVAGRTMKAPSYEDLFIILALHVAKHVWGKLIWLCDLARIIQRENLDWTEIGVRARQLGIRRILGLNLQLVNRMLGAEIPAGAEQHALDHGSEDLAKMIEMMTVNGVPFELESVAYFQFMLRLRERMADRIRFVSRLLLTPGPGEWASIQMPDIFFPLYHLVRLSRVATRLVRS